MTTQRSGRSSKRKTDTLSTRPQGPPHTPSLGSPGLFYTAAPPPCTSLSCRKALRGCSESLPPAMRSATQRVSMTRTGPGLARPVSPVAARARQCADRTQRAAGARTKSPGCRLFFINFTGNRQTNQNSSGCKSDQILVKKEGEFFRRNLQVCMRFRVRPRAAAPAVHGPALLPLQQGPYLHHLVDRPL